MNCITARRDYCRYQSIKIYRWVRNFLQVSLFAFYCLGRGEENCFFLLFSLVIYTCVCIYFFLWIFNPWISLFIRLPFFFFFFFHLHKTVGKSVYSTFALSCILLYLLFFPTFRSGSCFFNRGFLYLIYRSCDLFCPVFRRMRFWRARWEREL